MLGAPVLNGAAGSLINLLDAVLINGFGLTTSSGVVVASNVATMTFGVAHPFSAGSVALVAGATPAGINGEHRVLTATPTVITFAVVAADGAATGTITAMVAGAGWTKPFTGTNLAAYKITDVTGTGCYLYVDDTATLVARVRGFESMSDINTGVGGFPTAAQYAAPGLWWSKSQAAGTTVPWKILADSRGFYHFVKNYATENQSFYFGDIVSLKSNDPYACVLRANVSSKAGTNTAITDDFGYSDGTQVGDGLYIARAANALGTAQKNFSAAAFSAGLTQTHYTGTVGFAYPSPVDNGLMLAPVVVYGATGIRGYMPGMYFSPQITNASFASGDIIAGSGALAGKTVQVVKHGPLVGAAVSFVDTITDWR